MARRKQGAGSQRIVLVTGGRGRIGGATARALAARGDVVIAVDRAVIPGGALSGGVVHLKADLAKEAQTRRAFRIILERYGRIDAAVLAAGDFVFGPFLSLSAREWERVFRNNVLTAFLCLQELARSMPKTGGGHVVLMGTIVDHRAVRGNAVYGASKAALRMLGDVVREEFLDTPMRITNVCLGAVASPMVRRMKGVDVRSALDPADVVRTVEWVLDRPLEPRFDEVRLFPSLGVNP